MTSCGTGRMRGMIVRSKVKPWMEERIGKEATSESFSNACIEGTSRHGMIVAEVCLL